MSDVTDADRERAFRALGWHESWGLDDLSDPDRNEVEDIAAALAEERAKARAPFREIAEEWATTTANDPGLAAYTAMVRIRRAAEETA